MSTRKQQASRLAQLIIKDDFSTVEAQELLRLNFLVYTFLSGALVTLLLLVSNIHDHEKNLMTADIFLIVSIVTMLGVMRFFHSYGLIFRASVTVFALMTGWIFMSGDVRRAIILSPIILMLAYFLLGARAGVAWTVAVLGSYSVIYEFLLLSSRNINVSWTDIITSGIILTFISALLYVFGGSYEKAEKLVRLQSEELSRSNTKLKEELQKNTGLTQKMQGVLESTEHNNAILEESKKALINVLEDSNELQTQLTQEKLSVEKKIQERTKQLEDEQARLRASIQTLDLGFLMTLSDGSSILHNPALLNISGISAQQAEQDQAALLKQLSKKIGHSYDLDAAVKKCQRTGAPFNASDVSLNDRSVRILGSAIQRKENDTPLGVVLLIQDRTEEKLLERSKDEFISIASHELRTPLTAIRGNISLIEMLHPDVFKDAEVKAMMTDINESVVRLITIVNQFLTTSRLEQKKAVFQFTKVDANKVIKRVGGELEPMATETGLKVIYKLNDRIPAVKTDESRFQSILNNLIGNAIKYTDKGTVTISTEADKKNVIIRVSDTGKGMDEENQRLLFRKFQQASDNILTRDDSHSTGLGLYITKLMIHQMGGKIELERSAVGVGSIFRVTLPIA